MRCALLFQNFVIYITNDKNAATEVMKWSMGSLAGASWARVGVMLWEEESCDMEISGLKLALTVLTEEESIRHVGDRSERKERERECLE